MAAVVATGESWRGSWLRKAMWAGAAALLLLPAAAMRFTAEVNWTASDFVFAAILLFGAAGIVEIAGRASRNLFSLWGAIFAVGTGFLTIWANAAVGMIGSEDNRYNLLFLGIVTLALLGAAAARFRAGGVAIVMTAAGVAQAIAGAAGMAQDPRGGILSAAFAVPWLIAALLFRQGAAEG